MSGNLEISTIQKSNGTLHCDDNKTLIVKELKDFPPMLSETEIKTALRLLLKEKCVKIKPYKLHTLRHYLTRKLYPENWSVRCDSMETQYENSRRSKFLVEKICEELQLKTDTQSTIISDYIPIDVFVNLIKENENLKKEVKKILEPEIKEDVIRCINNLYK